MDSRKVQFLINIQKDIDKLEKENTDLKRLEKLKSKFYDLTDIEDISTSSNISDESININLPEDKPQSGEKKEESSLPRYIYPASLYKFLFTYNQNPILKSTCHEIDANELEKINEYCNTEIYDFKKHLYKIIIEYKDIEKNYFASNKIKGLILGYLTGKNYYGNTIIKGWSNDLIKYNWSCKELEQWVDNNPSIPPNSISEYFRIKKKKAPEIKQFTSKITGQTIQNFKELVLHFKNLFHIRADNSLKAILEYKNSITGWNNKIDFEINNESFPSNIELFTDVDKLVQAYDVIIKLIIEKNKELKPQIKLSLSETENAIKLSIHHFNSVYGKTTNNAVERMGQTYSNLISKQINGLCNLYVKADFGQNNYAYINIWNGKKREAKKLESIKGVEHIFEFTKK